MRSGSVVMDMEVELPDSADDGTVQSFAVGQWHEHGEINDTNGARLFSGSGYDDEVGLGAHVYCFKHAAHKAQSRVDFVQEVQDFTVIRRLGLIWSSGWALYKRSGSSLSLED
eukprot:1155650-Pelagomonas_calceolata.AAC.2